MADPLGALVSGVFGLFGNQQDYANSMEGMRQQHVYDLEMLQKNLEAQKDLFQYQFDANNSYNDPSAQIDRLVKAGLSPNLMYSSGSGASGVASGAMPSAPGSNTVSAPRFDQGSKAAEHLGVAFQNYLSAKHIENESKKANAEIGNLEAKTLSELLNYQRELDKDTPEWRNVTSLIDQRIVEMGYTRQQTATEEEHTKEAALRVQIAQFEKDAASYLPEQASKTVSKIVADIALSKSQAEAQKATTAYYYEQARLTSAQRVKTNIETAKLLIDTSFAKELNEATLAKLNADVAEVVARTDKISAETFEKDLDNVFKMVYGPSNDYVSSIVRSLKTAYYGPQAYKKAAQNYRK